jgi:uncharacterized RDD family membrane protein YckC
MIESALSGPNRGATFGHRLAARVVDFLLIVAAGYVFNFIAILLALVSLALSFGYGKAAQIIATPPSSTSEVVRAVGATLAYFLIYPIFESIYGATPGKRLLGLVVVARDGTRCTFPAAAIRSLAFLLDALVAGLVAMDYMKRFPLNQRYGDWLTRTVVAYRKDIDSHQRGSAKQFVAALAVSLLLLAVVSVIQTILRYAGAL